MTYLLTVYLQGKDVASVKALLVFGADINSLNGSGQTPLDIAVRDDNMEMVEYLATLGAFTGEYMLQLQQAWALEGLHLGKDKDGKEAGITDVAMSMKLQGKDKTWCIMWLSHFVKQRVWLSSLAAVLRQSLVGW